MEGYLAGSGGRRLRHPNPNVRLAFAVMPWAAAAVAIYSILKWLGVPLP